MISQTLAENTLERFCSHPSCCRKKPLVVVCTKLGPPEQRGTQTMSPVIEGDDKVWRKHRWVVDFAPKKWQIDLAYLFSPENMKSISNPSFSQPLHMVTVLYSSRMCSIWSTRWTFAHHFCFGLSLTVASGQRVCLEPDWSRGNKGVKVCVCVHVFVIKLRGFLHLH